MAYILESLVKVLERILCPNQRGFFDHKTIPQIESLLEKACFLRDSLENSATFVGNRIASLEDQIRDAAQNAEDVLETYVADHLSQMHRKNYFLFKSGIPTPNLQKVLENFDSVKEEMMNILDGGRITNSISPATSSRIDPNPKKIVVGFTDDLIQLKDRVLGDSSKLGIIPIVGMGGIGKTTLARNVYDDSSVVSHFDARAWTTVSDDYSLRDILLGLLSCITGRHRDEMIQEKDSQLSVTLHKKLIGRRFLIILDDIWRSKAWDDVKMFFPNENNGSRIILTTRESDMATYVDSKSSHHQMQPLSKVDSWKLLREKVFGEETCPSELEELGVKIANNCGGLPLAIQVIGGLLSHAKSEKDYWEKVSDDVSTTLTNKDEQFSRIFSLSYDHLPHYLKPCFLYMAAFPEDYGISASKLVRLWVAEGFLKPIQDKSLEETAQIYLEALIDRNLIFAVQRKKTNGKVKFCVMHDLLRDLCVARARNNKFLHVMNGQPNNIPEDMLCPRRVIVHTSHCNGDVYSAIGQMSRARSLIFIGAGSRKIMSHFCSPLRLLKVLDVMEIGFPWFPREILKLVNLRYLAFTGFVSPRISTLKNLQTLIVVNKSFSEITPEIFNMPHLREIQFIGLSVWCNVKESKDLVLQPNLHTLSGLKVSNFDMISSNIPNLKILAIHYRYKTESSAVTDLARLSKLERLKCSSDLVPNTRTFLSNLSFPISLKNLSLTSCIVPDQACMKIIGMLPNLEILKLESVFFESRTWEPTEGEFCTLKFLRLERLNLIYWPSDETHFPRLQHLKIRECESLNEIPSGIGEISTLKTIQVLFSSPSVAASARKIQEEQLECGNYLLQVDVFPPSR